MVLSLAMKETKNWSAVGRSRTSATPVLTRVQFYRLPESQELPLEVS